MPYRPQYTPDEPAFPRHEYQDQKERDRFYGSKRWKTLRKSVLALNPICQICCHELATQVHHLQPRLENPDLAWRRTNLQATCRACHSREHRTPRR